jgi:hypothetical protein
MASDLHFFVEMRICPAPTPNEASTPATRPLCGRWFEQLTQVHLPQRLRIMSERRKWDKETISTEVNAARMQLGMFGYLNPSVPVQR